MSKKRYYFVADVTEVRGSQTFYADAESEEEAKAIIDSGDGVFDSEELEVQDLDRFRLCLVEEIPPA